MAAETKLTVGQTLWFVPSDRRGYPRNVTVEKVGRKWAALSNRMRINVDTLHADGGGYSSPGRAWRSESEHAAETDRQLAWSLLRLEVNGRYGAPVHLTIEQIKSVLAIISKPEDPSHG